MSWEKDLYRFENQLGTHTDDLFRLRGHSSLPLCKGATEVDDVRENSDRWAFDVSSADFCENAMRLGNERSEAQEIWLSQRI